jgi:hypothetical protein
VTASLLVVVDFARARAMHRRRRAVLRYHAPVRLCVRQNQDVVPAVRWAVREIGEACDPLVPLPRA